MKLFFAYCLLVAAAIGFLTFYNNNEQWHALIFGASVYLWALYILRSGDSE